MHDRLSCAHVKYIICELQEIMSCSDDNEECAQDYKLCTQDAMLCKVEFAHIICKKMWPKCTTMCKLWFRNVIGHLHETIFCKIGQGLTYSYCVIGW